jgi:predicted NAD/FAD-dependent oxidoreductase
MRNKRLPSAISDAGAPPFRAKGVSLSRAVHLWITDGQAAGWRPRTVAARRDMLAKFGWWLEQEGLSRQLDASRFRCHPSFPRLPPRRAHP